MEKKTTFTCPECGAELEVSVVSNKAKHDGETCRPVSHKEDTRLEMLRKAGVDTSCFYAVGDLLIKVADGKPMLADDDPVVAEIFKSGTCKNMHMYNRFVLSHFINLAVKYIDGKMVRETSNGKEMQVSLKNVRKHISELGYDYAWDVVENMFAKRLACKRHGDSTAYTETARWYSYDLVRAMMKHYMDKFDEYVEKVHTHKCKGENYIKLLCGNLSKEYRKGVFVAAIPSVREECNMFLTAALAANTDGEMYDIVKRWNAVRPKLGKDIRKGKEFVMKPCDAWVNAYEGYGAYHAMQNLIKFHGCRIKVERYGKSESMFSQQQSEVMLSRWADEHTKDSWWLTGAFKKLVNDNGIDLEAKKREWAEAKRAKNN